MTAKRLINLACTTLLSLTCLSATAAFATDVPDEVPFGEPRFYGSGCPEGTISFAPTETAFTVLFSEYFVEGGQGTTWRDRFKYCRIHVPIDLPTGWQIKIDSVDYRGFAETEPGSRARFKSHYRIHGKRYYDFGTSRTTKVKGDFADDFERRDSSLLRKPRWSKCGGRSYLTLFNYMHTHARRGTGSYMAIDSADAAASLKYGMKMRRCR